MILDLRAYLLNDETIKGIIGDRIFPSFIPEGQKTPCIVYTDVNTKDKTSLQGDCYSEEFLFQLDCYGKNYGKVQELKSAVKEAMYKFSYHPYNYNSRCGGFEPNTQLHRQIIQFKLKT